MDWFCEYVTLLEEHCLQATVQSSLCIPSNDHKEIVTA